MDIKCSNPLRYKQSIGIPYSIAFFYPRTFMAALYQSDRDYIIGLAANGIEGDPIWIAQQL